MMHQKWWKALGVLLLLYVFGVGMLAPLKPGITGIDPQAGNTGAALAVEVNGYNTHFDEAEDSIRVWLRLGKDHALAAGQIDVKGPTRMVATFDIPSYLPSSERVQPFSLVMDNAIDGPAVLPEAVFIKQDSIDPEKAEEVWPSAAIDDLSWNDAFNFPFRNVIEETIRNLYFHVALWFAMVLLLLGSLVYSIRYLRAEQGMADQWASSLASVGILYGLLGLLTGAIWARYTWGEFWSWDIKQITTLIALMIYLAYFALRSAFPDEERRGRVSAVYNIFAFVALIILIGVLPRLPSVESLHPGNGGNPGLAGDDLDNTMRMVFYPAIFGWTLIGYWIGSLRYRALRAEEKMWERETEMLS